jgi:hypothetical protein
VSQVADRGSTDASSETDEEERSVRLDDSAASGDRGKDIVLVVVTAHIGALDLLATTAQKVLGSRNVSVRVATVVAGQLDCVSLVALLAAIPLNMKELS